MNSSRRFVYVIALTVVAILLILWSRGEDKASASTQKSRQKTPITKVKAYIPDEINPGQTLTVDRLWLERKDLPPVQCAPVNIVQPGACNGVGLVIEDKDGDYLITARKVFLGGGVFETQMGGIEPRRVVTAIDDTKNSVVVCLLGTYRKKVEVKSTDNGIMQVIDKARKDWDKNSVSAKGTSRFNIIRETTVPLLLSWPKISTDSIETLDTDPIRDNSEGMPFTESASSQTVWVNLGRWPVGDGEKLRKLSGNINSFEFTTLAGLSWIEIERIRQELRKKYPEEQAK